LSTTGRGDTSAAYVLARRIHHIRRCRSALARKAPTAILCAEHLPENCHRSLIADYLTLQGVSVMHLIDADEQREHQLDPRARRESASLVYDRGTTGNLALN